MSYNYIKSKKEFEEKIPYSISEIHEFEWLHYPDVYPCIVFIEKEPQENYAPDVSIMDFSDFIYQDGFLYKKCQ